MKKDEKKGKKEEREIVSVDIRDVMEVAKESIMMSNGGIGLSDIEYVGDAKDLKFSIPKRNRKGKCDEICTSDEEGGCGETGGSCICGLKEGHEEKDGTDHKCELCGHEW